MICCSFLCGGRIGSGIRQFGETEKYGRVDCRIQLSHRAGATTTVVFHGETPYGLFHKSHIVTGSMILKRIRLMTSPETAPGVQVHELFLVLTSEISVPAYFFGRGRI